MKILGYKRKNGTIGTRNHVLVLPLSICPSTVAQRISSNIIGAVSVFHQHGLCEVGPDLEQTIRVFKNIARNGNVGSVLVVALGNEGQIIDIVVNDIKKAKKDVELITIKQCGGSVKATAKGIEVALNMVQKLSSQKRQEIDLAKLIIGLKCGGTDVTSELAANPVFGYTTDYLIKRGATAIFSETTEIIGAEHLLLKRIKHKDVQEKLLKVIEKTEKRAADIGVNLQGVNPTAGNIESGVSTLEEKSLCAINKSGSMEIRDILDYGEIPKKNGLYFMDTPGHDVDSISGMIAGGAQVILFSSGRGTPIGSPIAPVIKVTGNHEAFCQMNDNFDIDTSNLLEKDTTIKKTGGDFIKEVIQFSSGKLTKSEILKHYEFGIYRIGPTF